MKMRFSRRGRQFFFLTFGLKGRPKVLSRIVAVDKPAAGARGEAPSVVRAYDTALTPWGEAVVDEWKGQHGQNPALTASARVVMPDHCHFLLIVNYDRDPNFDVLDWLHHFRRAIEARWAALRDDGRGGAPNPEWETAFWLANGPFAALSGPMPQAKSSNRLRWRDGESQCRASLRFSNAQRERFEPIA